MLEKEIVKVIGRISKKGNEYLQTAVNVEGEETKWLPVFLKKGVEKLNYISKERKVDSRGIVYDVYDIDAKNIYFPEIDQDNTESFEKAIIMK